MTVEKLYRVYVNARAIYEVSATSEKDAHKKAIEAAEESRTPDDIEYAGDGVEYAVEV